MKLLFIRYNCNPLELEVGDCVIRAISTALNFNWFMVHDELSHLSRKMADMPSSNRVWKEYLRSLGLVESVVDTECPNCITVDKFAKRNNEGTYIVSTCEFTKTNDIVVTGTHLEEAMKHANSEQEREAIRKLINQNYR